MWLVWMPLIVATVVGMVWIWRHSDGTMSKYHQPAMLALAPIMGVLFWKTRKVRMQRSRTCGIVGRAAVVGDNGLPVLTAEQHAALPAESATFAAPTLEPRPDTPLT